MAKQFQKTASSLTKRNEGKKRIAIGEAREVFSELAQIIAEESRDNEGVSVTLNYLIALAEKKLKKLKAAKK
jgi:hypothetical protein